MSHTGFIVAAYLIAFAALAGLALWTWAHGRSVSSRLEQVEASRPNRRAQRRERRDET